MYLAVIRLKQFIDCQLSVVSCKLSVVSCQLFFIFCFLFFIFCFWFFVFLSFVPNFDHSFEHFSIPQTGIQFHVECAIPRMKRQGATWHSQECGAPQSVRSGASLSRSVGGCHSSGEHSTTRSARS